jgi:hypothetical protein
MITITLETLGKVESRATGRIDGRTVLYRDGFNGASLVREVMRHVASAHRISGDTYDMTHIQLNDAATAAISSKG